MIHSMTGYARNSTQAGEQTWVWELRSVNHRYLDLRLQLPEATRLWEPELRAEIGQAINRGKVDAQLRVEFAAGGSQIRFVAEQARALIQTLREIDQMMVNGARVSALDILNWPGVLLKHEEPDSDNLRAAVFAGLNAALQDLQAMRANEGAVLRNALLTRLDTFTDAVRAVRGRRAEIVPQLRERLLTRVAELDLSLDPQRLEQEVMLQAQRLDVAEELDRLDGHIAAAREILDRAEPVGRRLDFLLQEFNREANTLGSKAQDLETTRVVMEMKVLTEQMREQVQNIE